MAWAARDFGGTAGNLSSSNYTITVLADSDRSSIGYDNNGNCTGFTSGGVTTSYEWDAEDRLVAFDQGTHRSEFYYDGTAIRVKNPQRLTERSRASNIRNTGPTKWTTVALMGFRNRNRIMGDLTLNFFSPCGHYVLTFDDNCRVAYAYLKDNMSRILGEVWLYNRVRAPSCKEWLDKKNIPFANCAEYISPGATVHKQVSRNDVQVDWDNDGKSVRAYIYIFGDLFGMVGIDDKPGYARHALKDGPVARVMEFEDDL